MGYKDDLKTAHWQKRRLEVLEKANWLCEDCGAGGDTQLQVHHTFYQYGKKPWEYEDEFLMCLCEECHKQRGEDEKVVRMLVGYLLRRLSLKEITWLVGFLYDMGRLSHARREEIFDSAYKGSK